MKILGLLLCLATTAAAQPQWSSWKTAQQQHSGRVAVYWYDNKPFAYVDPVDGQRKGLEVDLIGAFQDFLNRQYHIALTVQWIKLNSFEEVMREVKKSGAGRFGLAGFSLTDERKTFMKFSPPYMADIAVLVSTPDIPIVNDQNDLKKYLSGGTAITIAGTLMEKDLREILTREKIPFHLVYVPNSAGFLEAINDRRQAFGYLSLPVYLMNLNQSVIHLKRQNYFTQKKQGHAIGLSLSSDWDAPLQSYFASHSFRDDDARIIGRYLNLELYDFISGRTPESTVNILNKEKELQVADLRLKDAVILRDRQQRSFLIAAAVLVSGLIFTIAVLFRNNLRDHRRVMAQKKEIERQSAELKSINEHLEKVVRQRSEDLIRKNKALESYTAFTTNMLTVPAATIRQAVEEIEPDESTDLMPRIVGHLKQAAASLSNVVAAGHKSSQGTGKSA